MELYSGIWYIKVGDCGLRDEAFQDIIFKHDYPVAEHSLKSHVILLMVRWNYLIASNLHASLHWISVTVILKYRMEVTTTKLFLQFLTSSKTLTVLTVCKPIEAL